MGGAAVPLPFLGNHLGPLLASSLLALGGMRLVILADLLTFGAAFLTLAFFIRIPRPPERDEGAGVLDAPSGTGCGFEKKPGNSGSDSVSGGDQPHRVPIQRRPSRHAPVPPRAADRRCWGW